MKKIISVLASLLFIIVAFSGCVTRLVPYEYFDSLSELKDSIDDNFDIFFPDTARYVFADDAMLQKVYKGKSNILEGYSFGGDLNTAQSDTDLSSLYFSCSILEIAYDERNPVPPLNANTKVLGLSVYESIVDQSKNPDYLASGRYQEGSAIMSYNYQFDLNGCRYSISAHMVITPEELNDMDTDEVEFKIERCKTEVLDFVISIFEQEE